MRRTLQVLFFIGLSLKVLAGVSPRTSPLTIPPTIEERHSQLEQDLAAIDKQLVLSCQRINEIKTSFIVLQTKLFGSEAVSTTETQINEKIKLLTSQLLEVKKNQLAAHRDYCYYIHVVRNSGSLTQCAKEVLYRKVAEETKLYAEVRQLQVLIEYLSLLQARSCLHSKGLVYFN